MNLNTPILGEQKQHEFLEDTRVLSMQSSIANILLAGRLHKIREEKLWISGYESFEDYCMNLKTYNYGTISKLITVYKKFVLEYEISQEKLAEVGYTVLYKAHKVLGDKKDAEEFVDNAIIWTGSDINREISSRKIGKDIKDCEHEETIVIRLCKTCGERWELHDHDHA
jgi:hypothetical protein